MENLQRIPLKVYPVNSVPFVVDLPLIEISEWILNVYYISGTTCSQSPKDYINMTILR